MPGTTTNRLNRFPVGADAANVPSDITNLANDLDNVANIYTGTLAGRSAATAAAGHGVGNPGSFYFATDTQELFVSIAGAWVKVTTEPGIPLGAQIPYGGSGDPADARFLLADGRALARSGQYAPLFAVISTTYGTGDGSTTFNIPDKRGRVSVGQDNMGTAAGAAGRLPNSLNSRGQVNGEERHTMTAAELVSHRHRVFMDTGVGGSYNSVILGSTSGGPRNPAVSDVDTSGTQHIENTGSTTPFNVLQPGQLDNMLVRVK